MKKIILILSALCVMGLSAKAEEFFPGWQFGVRGGAAYTVGETSFDKLVSPNVSVTAGYQFLPWISLRGDLSGWEAKAYATNIAQGYSWNYVQLGADVIFDFCGMCKNYKFRVANPYAFVGIGCNWAFNNGGNTNEIIAGNPHPTYVWTDNLVSPVARIGLGIDFNVCRSVAITLEFTDNILSDKFNSKRGDMPLFGLIDCDYQISGLLGVKFMFGQAKKAKKAAADAALAAEAAAAAAAIEAQEKAAAEAQAKAAAEAQVVTVAAEVSEADKAAYKEAADKAAINAAIGVESRLNPYFAIGSSKLTDESKYKLDQIKVVLSAFPEYNVNVVGYADKETGTSDINFTLSEERAKACAAYLESVGVSGERMIVSWKGDTELPFDGAKLEQKRTVIFFSK